MASARVIIRSNLCPKIAARFPDAVNKIVREQVLESEGRVKINIVSYGAVDTGNLLNSVAGEMTGQFSGEVAVGAEYGIYVNFGTVFVSPRPYFTDETHRAETAFPARFKRLEGMLS